jgi:hypothetical protein
VDLAGDRDRDRARGGAPGQGSDLRPLLYYRGGYAELER